MLRRVLVDILELRGFTVTADHRARIQSCDSLETLEGWYTKARSLPAHASVELLFDA
ncbi:hypothetical protein DB30_04153 [Enhygromyxa salina]|uniref:Uncharacterized protein n=1 Tax=Enhygromyxa salina TaxID=215803 RepID=A0A0C2CUC6_9BACT|nr:hypothetical protein DB30_04153 [Enhygromyxa salina]